METIKRIFRVDRRDINYLRSTIESYDGIAVVSTINPEAAVIEIQIAPGCEEQVFDLLDSIRKNENIAIS